MDRPNKVEQSKVSGIAMAAALGVTLLAALASTVWMARQNKTLKKKLAARPDAGGAGMTQQQQHDGGHHHHTSSASASSDSETHSSSYEADWQWLDPSPSRRKLAAGLLSQTILEEVDDSDVPL